MLNANYIDSVAEFNPKLTTVEDPNKFLNKIVELQTYEMNMMNQTYWNMKSKFTLEAAVLTFQKAWGGEDFLWPMKARDKAAEAGMTQAITSWECYSETCPDFIIVNAN